MIVRRLKPDELQHHGIKGQRWGVRRFQNADGSLTGAGKNRYGNGLSNSGKDTSDPRAKKRNTQGKNSQTTGNSKGVHRRGEGLGTGPVGKPTKSKIEGEYQNFLSSQHNKKSNVKVRKTDQGLGVGFDMGSTDQNGQYHVICRWDISYDSNLTSNQLGCYKYKDDGDVDNFRLTFKNEDEALKWLYSSAAETAMNGDATVFLGFLNVANNKGTLNYDSNTLNAESASEMPYAAYTNLSDIEQTAPAMSFLTNEEGELDPSRQDVETWKTKQKLKEKNRKRQEEQNLAEHAQNTNANLQKLDKKRIAASYRNAAKQSYEQAQEHLKNNKKLSTKVKRFAESWNEVRFEEISKVASAFKKKK